MKALSIDQFNKISTEISKANFSLITLQDELIDHACCEIEMYMESGHAFDTAFMLFFGDLSITTLQDLQEETYLLTNKHYATMKTTMKWGGIVSLSAISIATLMRLLHLTGSDIVLVLGFVSLTFLFLPATIFLDYSTAQNKALGQRISLLIGCAFICNGMLFKVMYWNGANILILSGSLLMMLFFMPQLYASITKSQSTSDEKRVTGFGMLSVLIFTAGILFKILHWPGAKVLFILGSVLLIGIFIPLYAYRVLQKKEKSMAPFVYLVVLAVYIITMSGLIQVNSNTSTNTASQDFIIHQEIK